MKLVRPLIFAVVLATAFFYFTTWRSNSAGEFRSTWFSRPDQVEITEAAPNEPLDGEEQNNISVYKKNIPSVVNVTSRAMTFDFFYGLVPQEGQGSGFVIDKEGHILTNYHVIADARQVEVTLHNRKKYKATVVGTDPAHDLAVIQIKAPELVPAILGDSRNLQVGQKVYAIGNPFGLSGTMTRGIVSSIRPVREPNGAMIDEAIQTDAAINPGNSGGALINARGELIGINTAILSGGSGGNQGIGFAIPINLARYVMDQILKYGKVTRGFLGVGIQDVSAPVAKTYGVPANQGAIISDVQANSPAAKVGLERGDVITELNGQPVQGANDLKLKVGEMRPGTTVHLKVLHNGAARDVSLTLGEQPENQQRAGAGSTEQQPGLMQGVEVQDLTPDILQQLGLPGNTKGVVVANVAPGSAAEAAGLQRGDVIEQVNRHPVDSVSQYDREVRAAGNQTIVLLVNRGGSTAFVVVQAP